MEGNTAGTITKAEQTVSSSPNWPSIVSVEVDLATVEALGWKKAEVALLDGVYWAIGTLWTKDEVDGLFKGKKNRK